MADCLAPVPLVAWIYGEGQAAFAQGGGEILFGTDVGYLTDYDPTQEYALMARAGLSHGPVVDDAVLKYISQAVTALPTA